MFHVWDQQLVSIYNLEIEKTPTKPFVAKSKKKVSPEWKVGEWLNVEYEFGLKTIMNRLPWKLACEIVRSIKKHALKDSNAKR